MAKHERISLGTVIAEPAAVFDRVETERTTLTIMRGEEAVAVISPGPLSGPVGDLHEALYADTPESTFFLDVIETRRLLGL